MVHLIMMETWSYRLLFVVGAIALGVGVRAWLFEPEPVTVKVVLAEIGRVEDTVTNSRAGTVKARQRAHQDQTPTRDGPVDTGWRRAWAKDKPASGPARSWP